MAGSYFVVHKYLFSSVLFRNRKEALITCISMSYVEHLAQMSNYHMPHSFVSAS